MGVRGGGSSSSSSIQKSLCCLDLVGVDGPGSLSRRRLTGDKVGDFATNLSKATIAEPEVCVCLGIDGPAMLSCPGVESPGLARSRTRFPCFRGVDGISSVWAAGAAAATDIVMGRVRASGLVLRVAEGCLRALLFGNSPLAFGIFVAEPSP